MIDIRGIRQRWESDGSKRDERGRRVFAASEARAAGHGGVTAVSQITGLARSTIGRGLEDLDPARVDLSGGTIAIRSLKKRRDASGSAKIVFRSVPVPAEFLDTLDIANGLREAQKSRKKAAAPIWPVSRVRIWQIVKHVMIEAGIPDGPHRSPKGLRHGYGVHVYRGTVLRQRVALVMPPF